MSRNTKLTPEVQDLIIGILRAGHYQETAANFAGITATTFYNWLQRGREEGEGIYFEFLEAVEKAKAIGEVADLKVINDAARDGSWQAAAWKLERKFPTKWGRVVRTEITGAEGAPVKVEVDAKTELKRLLGLLDDPNSI